LWCRAVRRCGAVVYGEEIRRGRKEGEEEKAIRGGKKLTSGGSPGCYER